MVGFLLVGVCLALTVIITILLYFNRTVLTFFFIGILFFWSSGAYFLAYNYEGWPARESYPKSKIIAIEVVEPVGDKLGQIFIWVYHVNILDKPFWKFNSSDLPRVYSIKYDDKAQKAFSEAKELLAKGYILYIGDKDNLPSSDGDGKNKGKDINEIDGNQYIQYNDNKPQIEAINPRKLLTKE